MGWLVRHNWLWALLAFVLGAVITWFLLVRREQGQARVEAEQQARKPADEKSSILVGAGVAVGSEPSARTTTPAPAEPEEPAAAEPVVRARDAKAESVTKPAPFSRRMEANGSAEATLFDAAPDSVDVVPETAEERGAAPADVVPEENDEVPAGRYGEGSADAVPHQGPPDGFTIKGNAQSMLFHTPDSPYYGRTKPQIWFRTEADAERAGFTKYVRRPRKSPGPKG